MRPLDPNDVPVVGSENVRRGAYELRASVAGPCTCE
jgi:hypothetical protein